MKEVAGVIVRIVLAICGLSFICSLCWQKERTQKQEEQQTISSTAGFRVLVETDKGVMSYDPEELLMPMMLAMLPQEGEQKLQELSESAREEFWKLLSVVCRTNLVKEWEDNGRKEQWVLSKEIFYMDTDDINATKEGNNIHEDENDIRKAIDATKGIILCFQEQTIEASFCYASAGQTRNANEIFGDDSYPYLSSVACADDKESIHYFAQYHFEKAQFYEKLQKVLFGENQLQQEMEISMEHIVIEKESTGYVRRIGYEQEGIWIDATSFQEAFGLQSPNFLIEERETEMVMTTKGIGHGLGLSVYQACCMAGQEKSMEEILTYFYAGVTLEKKYV